MKSYNVAQGAKLMNVKVIYGQDDERDCVQGNNSFCLHKHDYT